MQLDYWESKASLESTIKGFKAKLSHSWDKKPSKEGLVDNYSQLEN